MDAMTGSRYVASSTNTGNHHIRILGRDAIPGRGSTRAPPKSDWVKIDAGRLDTDSILPQGAGNLQDLDKNQIYVPVRYQLRHILDDS